MALSSNFDDRPKGYPINTLVLHYTGMPEAIQALARMCDPAFKVSAHYMVDEDGTVTQLVEEGKRAWHAGKSYWRGYEKLNDLSIGIEIVNPGHEWGYQPFPKEQMEAVITLCKGILSRHPKIEPRNVIAHSDIAPDRKEDPGELFEWPWLANEGIGIWPEIRDIGTPKDLLKEGDSGEAVCLMQQGLARYGYLIKEDGAYGTETAQVVTAFKRHFAPETLSATWDTLAEARLAALLSQVA
ncbi:MAG: N-acetylmuramoyl-L-alanine amidase [Rickettsiales bacterium]|jgi:N-acetylmuramoyl-L-alanine amidase|nr:N-acetylmuramoyl-L-alanine amidase [Rickettsiales bacterium]